MTTPELEARRDEEERPLEPEAPPVQLYRRLLRTYLKPYAGLFTASIVCMGLAAAFDALSMVLIIPFLRALFDLGGGGVAGEGPRNSAEEFIDFLVGDFISAAGGLEALRNVCVVVFAALVLKNLFFYGGKLLSIVVQERVERDMRDDVYATMERLPLSFFQGTKAGQLIARVLTDTRETKSVVTFGLADVIRQAATAVAYLAMLLAISWKLTIYAVVLAPLLALVLKPVFARLRSGFRTAFDHQGDLLAILQETVSGIRLVKAYGAEEYEEGRFRERSDDYAGSLVKSKAIAHLASPLSETMGAAVFLALVWFGATMVMGDATVGPESFVAFVTIALRFISPIKAISQFPAQVQQSLAAADRFLDVLDHPPEPEDRPDAREARAVEEAIRFEGVTFAYEPGRPVLEDVSFTARQGETVALVGPSGAGKSTLVDLLPRFIEPDEGRITLDGTDLREFTLDSLRRMMGIVSQDVVIFNDTVRANIAYGDPDGWSPEEIRRAAEAAHAHEFIREMDGGYEAPLGDRGVRLSGGQRQRIGLARAVLRDPPILILDEATSSLDTESERLIQDALSRLLVGRTVFVIAHRLSTVQGADRIVVLEDGRLVEEGTHGELYEANGVYRRLYEMQFEGEGVTLGTGAD